MFLFLLALKQKKSSLASGVSGSVPLAIDLYLGHLFTVEDYKIYGYITNTKVKFVVILQDCSQEVNMKQWFRDLHTLYVRDTHV